MNTPTQINRLSASLTGITPAATLSAEPAGDFLMELHHAPAAFGLIVGEGNA
jgi:hypothetical protein